jgi:hypothetical protein
VSPKGNLVSDANNNDAGEYPNGTNALLSACAEIILINYYSKLVGISRE